MTLFEEIQNSAIDSTGDLGKLLRQCRLLAAKLDNKPLEDWIIWELNGYPNDAPVPDYRKFSLELKGNFVGAYGRALNNAPIPMLILPKEFKENFDAFEYRASISTIEELLQNNDSNVFRFPTGDLAVLLGQSVYNGLNCIQCWLEGSRGHLVEAINAVRNRTLEFILALQKQFPLIGETTLSRDNAQSATISQIFHTTVYGGAANLVGSAQNSTIHFNIHKDDFESLSKLLKEHGVSDADVKELDKAVKSDPVPKEQGKFGAKVSAWIAYMIQKSASGTWEVGLGAAATLLGQALAKYYGFV
jgi:hypothetical protein